MKIKPSLLASAACAAGGSMLDERAVTRRIRMWRLGAVAFLLATPAYAQQDAFPTPHPLDAKIEDENNVDVLTGTAHFVIPDASIADFAHVKTVWAYDRTTQPELNTNPPTEQDNFIGGLTYEDARDHSNPSAWFPRPYYQVRIHGLGGNFYINQNYTLTSFDGSSLTGNGVSTWVGAGDHPQLLDSNLGTWTFTSRDGTIVDIDTNNRPRVGYSQYLGIATKITYPSGLIIRINYRPDCIGTAPRIQSVTRNDGLMLKYVYADTTCTAQLTNVIAINLAYEYCDPLADTCTVDPKWRRSQYSYTTVNSKPAYNVTDQSGTLSRFTQDKWGRVVSYKPPLGQDETSFTYCLSYFTSTTPGYSGQAPTLSGPNPPDPDESFCGEMVNPGSATVPAEWNYIRNRVLTATRSAKTWGYSLPVLLAPNSSPYPRQYTITRPIELPTTVIMDARPGGGLISFVNPALANISYVDAESQRISSGQTRGQPARTFSYDPRGNITTDGITSAGYDTSCANIITCNKPNWVKDARGNQSTFIYDPAHGGIKTETRPADPNGIQPQKRYTYVQRNAWYLNSSSTMTRSTEPIWKLASESYCRTGPAATLGTGCQLNNDEVVTTYDYGPDTGPPNNLWLHAVTVTADGQSLRTCYGYDKFGNKISETSPRGGCQ